MHILREPDKVSSEIPQPRFAHQVVYNPKTKSVFLHGGNSGGARAGEMTKTGKEADGDPIIVDEDTKDGSSAGQKEKRLNDFWRMELKR